MTRYSEMQFRDTIPIHTNYETGDLWSRTMIEQIQDWASDDSLDADVPFDPNPVDSALRAFDRIGFRSGAHGQPVAAFKDYVGDVVRYKRFRLTRWPNSGRLLTGAAVLFVGDRVRSVLDGQTWEGEVVISHDFSGLAQVLLWMDSDQGWPVSSLERMYQEANPGLYEVGVRRGGSYWWVPVDTVGPVDTVVPLESSADRAVVAADDGPALVEPPVVVELRGRLERAERQAARARERVAIIMAALLEEAEDRGWCTDHDKFLSKLESDTGEDFSEYRRTRRVRATWRETYTVTVTRSEVFEGSDLVDEDGGADLESVGNYIDNDDALEERIQSALDNRMSEPIRVDYSGIEDDSISAYIA